MPVTITKNPQSGTTQYSFGTVGSFEVPSIDPIEKTALPVTMFGSAADHFGKLTEQMAEVTSDSNLSELGRQRKLEPLQKQVVLSVANLESTLELEERHWNQREAELNATPKIDPGNVVAAIEAREARDWFRGLSAQEQAKVLQQMNDEPQGNETLILAFLRSPVPTLDIHAKFAREVWQRTRAEANPSEAHAIGVGRANLEWARRGAMHLAGIAKRTIGWGNEQIARTLLTTENPAFHTAHRALNVPGGVMENMKRVIAQEAGKR